MDGSGLTQQSNQSSVSLNSVFYLVPVILIKVDPPVRQVWDMYGPNFPGGGLALRSKEVKCVFHTHKEKKLTQN